MSEQAEGKRPEAVAALRDGCERLTQEEMSAVASLSHAFLQKSRCFSLEDHPGDLIPCLKQLETAWASLHGGRLLSCKGAYAHVCSCMCNYICVRKQICIGIRSIEIIRTAGFHDDVQCCILCNAHLMTHQQRLHVLNRLCACTEAYVP